MNFIKFKHFLSHIMECNIFSTTSILSQYHIDGLAQDGDASTANAYEICGTSISNALEIP